jgi:hypothetical protein
VRHPLLLALPLLLLRAVLQAGCLPQYLLLAPLQHQQALLLLQMQGWIHWFLHWVFASHLLTLLLLLLLLLLLQLV